MLPDAVPVSAAVIVPALKFPDPSRATIADEVFAFVAVVAEFGILVNVFDDPDSDLLVSVEVLVSVQRLSLLPEIVGKTYVLVRAGFLNPVASTYFVAVAPEKLHVNKTDKKIANARILTSPFFEPQRTGVVPEKFNHPVIT